MEEEKEGFLSRWSRRKRAVEEAAEPAAATPPAVVEEVPAAGAEAEAPPPGGEADEAAPAAPVARASCPIPDVPEIDPASLPPIESLTAESDFAQFLRPGVPTLLRNAALRRMWSVDPAIRDYIGPVDYQWDFNTPGGLPFGFANELGGDVKKLLAQAIGKIEELAEEEEGEGEPAEAGSDPPDSLPVDATPVEEPPAALVAEAPPALDQPIPPPAEQPAGAVADAAAAAWEEPAQAPRRRHGGALPG